MSKKKGSNEKITKFIAQRRSYLIGIGLGITLIIINTVIGLYVVNLVLESADDTNVVDFEELPVPKIKEQEYLNFRDDFIQRQKLEVKQLTNQDPFDTL